MTLQPRLACTFPAILLVALLCGTGARVLGQAPKLPPPPRESDPAVEGILATNPQTPKEKTRAAELLADLGRPALAKGLLKQVLDATLNAEQLADLGEELGATAFTELAARSDVAPEGRQLAAAVLEAMNARAQDPQRLGALVKQLQDASRDARHRALAGLVEARGAAVAPLLAALADPARKSEHAAARAALAQLKGDAVGPLIGILESDDAPMAAHAAQVLGQMEAEEAILYLLEPYVSAESEPAVRSAAGAALLKLVGELPTGPEAAALLARFAREYFDDERAIDEDLQGNTTVWRWDPAKKQPVGEELPAEIARRVLSARLAREAFALAPDEPQIRRLHLATMLELAKYEAGLDQPLPHGEGTAAARAAAFDVEVIEEVLDHAMRTGHAPAAAAAAEILGRKAEPGEVLQGGGTPAPLVLALRHGDRRLRMAALGAIMALKPQQRFPGSSFVPEALEFFAASQGRRRALVAAPNVEASMSLTGYLTARGYEVDAVVGGRAAVEHLIASPDYELVFLDARLSYPPTGRLIQQLRRDGRTAPLPVAVIADHGLYEKAQRMVRDDPRSAAFHRPHAAEAAHWQIDRLAKLPGRAEVPVQERQRQAAQAVAWLAELGAERPGIYDLQRAEDTLRAALFVPALSEQAARVLGSVGTPESQVALVDLASRATQPIEVRRAAADAFARSVRKHGILLTTDQIRRQYDRYNASAEADAQTQKVLGSLLDAIEAPTQPVAAADPDQAPPEENPEGSP